MVYGDCYRRLLPEPVYGDEYPVALYSNIQTIIRQTTNYVFITEGTYT